MTLDEKKEDREQTTTSRGIRDELLKKIAQPTIYKRINSVRKIAKKSISNQVALAVVASQEGIDVYSILKREGREKEIEGFKDAISRFDFDNKKTRKQRVSKTPETSEKEERSPYDLPLTKYNIDSELIADCKIQKPYRKAVSEAMLTLETRIRSAIGVDETFYGEKLIVEAKKQGVFKRKVQAEEDGLYFMYMGAIKWLRNPSGHRKIKYTKEDSVKMVLYADYLIKLFDDLVNKRI